MTKQPRAVATVELAPMSADLFSPPSHEPELRWASIPEDKTAREYDSATAPHYDYLAQRFDYHKKDLPLGSPRFWETVRRSKRLLILDTHFDAKAMAALRDKVGGALGLTEVRVLTAEKEAKLVFENFKSQLDRVNQFDTTRTYEMCLLSRKGFPHVHDRFAVTDGELWHFGGTVGGLEDCMTASSRGWDARSFVEFFDRVWGQLHPERARR